MFTLSGKYEIGSELILKILNVFIWLTTSASVRPLEELLGLNIAFFTESIRDIPVVINVLKRIPINTINALKFASNMPDITKYATIINGSNLKIVKYAFISIYSTMTFFIIYKDLLKGFIGFGA